MEKRYTNCNKESKEMKKKTLFLPFMALLFLTGCSTAESGVSVGNVHNTECSSSSTRSTQAGSDEGEDVPEIPRLAIKLTRQGNTISGEFTNYSVLCSHGDLYVDCQQTVQKLDINVREKKNNQGGLAAQCLCWVNIYFTLYDVEGDTFLLTLDGRVLGEISFKDSNVVEINL
jgi:hypothetical protein